ncbi:glutamate synthase (NADPH/NADH) small chain [Sphingobacterium allocomposti]|uniref:Glutamate synthase (NADPH/NADH) small chain n=1 Tax=Sphingobacterium allocomposti TaxID=415956 RepID=A0A5S5DVC6_9SPHI|nr:glutamate synthase subunit beta [Sphingobacterium composti Yoo et al. 2007 non Ten et al. 2007]TYP98579.1 glutamate synthase (NADPH/NADH) small chain [Sphingobacterium composti Yoo et al. 2007 non Ten et al. 2007]
MGKPTGFLEFERALPQKESVESRKQNYQEFVHRYSDDQLNNQAARCMNCGIPFCHSGCPLGNVIPEFNDAVYDGRWEEAYNILVSTNNFPEFTGRICPAPCEAACVLGINKSPVAIEEIEKHIIEIAYSKNYVQPNKSYIKTGKRVAVVGSGPAGLAAAAQLNKAGHDVVVYERDDKVGGLLRYGIPDFKLDKSVIDRRVDVMKQSGIEFRVNAEVGVNVPAGELQAYDAIVLAGGSTIPRNLPIPGRELKGVHFAMEFLKQQNKRVGNSPIEEEEIHAEGKNVLVIGGGDTGSDCVGTSNRHGAKSVTQFELMPQPPKERTEAMPWPTYPMLLKTTTSHEEGCQRFWSVSTKAFLGDDNGHVRAALVVDLEWETDALGRPIKFKEVEGSEREIPCELVTLAMGFLHPQHEGLLQQLGVKLNERGNVDAAEGEYKSSAEKVFVAGDMRRGQSLVVWAISEGRECARKVDEYLMGYSELERKDKAVSYA